MSNIAIARSPQPQAKSAHSTRNGKDGRGASLTFYLDPPYWGCEEDYGQGLFAPADFVRLAEILAGIKGRFLLSLNDRPEVREVFAGFGIEAVETTWSMGAQPRRAGEVLIGNLIKT